MYQLFYTPRKERFLRAIYFMQEHWKFLLHKNNANDLRVCHDLDKNQLFVTFLIPNWDFGLAIDNICKTAFAMA